MKKLVRAICVLSVIITLLGVSGCMKNNSAIDKMVDYMNDKYDDKFVYAAPFGGRIGAKTKQILVSSEKYPDFDIWVEYYVEDGVEKFNDNYINYKYKAETQEYIKSALEECFGCEVKLSHDVKSSGGNPAFDNDTSFEEYICTKESSISFTAVVSPEYVITDKETVSGAVKSTMKENGIVANGRVYFADKKSSFVDFSDMEIATIRRLKMLDFSGDEDSDLSFVEWRQK